MRMAGGNNDGWNGAQKKKEGTQQSTPHTRWVLAPRGFLPSQIVDSGGYTIGPLFDFLSLWRSLWRRRRASGQLLGSDIFFDRNPENSPISQTLTLVHLRGLSPSRLLVCAKVRAPWPASYPLLSLSGLPVEPSSPSPPFPFPFIPTNTRGDRCVTCSLTTSDTTTHCTLHFYLSNLLHKPSPTWLPHRPQSWPWRSKWPSSSNFNNLNNLNNLLPRERERGHSHLEATSRHSSTCRP